MNQPINLGPLGEGLEFDKIRTIYRVLGEGATGGGDDCAFLPGGTDIIAIGTDLAIEGVHFRLGWLEAREVGWRSTVATLSDLAAVAAEPLGVLISLGVTAEWPDQMIEDLMSGIRDAVRASETRVVGGDLVKSDRLVLDVVGVGHVDQPVRRSGAKVGDGLWVTGRLGGPAVALAAWGRGEEPERTARERFAAPTPRITAARWLKLKGARAMIDISDGLLADAGHLAAASRVRCVIESEAVPKHPSVTEGSESLVGGEEYELLVALPADAEPDVQDFERLFGIPLTNVGRVEEGAGVELLRLAMPVELPVGFRHF